MRNRLQYLYSILILVGVLISSYWMIEQRSNLSPLARKQAAKLAPVQASVAPSGLNQIFELETHFKVIEKVYEQPNRLKHNRLPTQQSLIKPSK